MSKTTNITIRVTEEQRNIIEAKAEQLKMTVSEYLRFVAINCEVNPGRVKDGMG